MQNNIEASTRLFKADLTAYSLVYAPHISAKSKGLIAEFAGKILQKTGSAPAIRESAPEGERAIYVGVVDHPSVKRARRAIEGCGWTICEASGNILITGTNQLFTNFALEYFAKNYLKGAKSAEIELPRKVVCSNMEAVPLISDGAYRYSVVYSAELDDIEGWGHIIPGNHSGGAAKDSIDRPVRICFELADLMASVAKRGEEKPAVHSDATEQACEVLVGIAARDAANKGVEALGIDEYALTVAEEKILLSAWNDEAVEYASNAFKAMITDAYSTKRKCRERLFLPVTYEKGKIKSNWKTDFPKPTGEGIALVGSLSSGEDSIIYCYRGEGVNKEAFEKYCRKLEMDGYVLLQKNAIDENRFATYFNTKANTTLNLEFADQHIVPFSYYTCEQFVKHFAPTLRVTSAPLSSVNLLPEVFLSPDAYKDSKKLTDTIITQVSFNYEAGDKGMCYIITLEDGTFVVADGSTNRNAMDDQIWQILCNLYKRVHGRAPAEKGDIHIRAWTMSHEHSDHYGSFLGFVRKYGKNPILRFDYLLANFTSKTQDYSALQPSHGLSDNLADLYAHCPDFKYIKVHTGQKLYIGNIEFEILFTHQDMAPYSQPFYNDTSTVFRTTIHNTTANRDDIFMILGDAAIIASTFMRSCYSSQTLRADLVQIGHHGGFGCENELYDIMQPVSTWWTHFATFVRKMCAPENRHKISLEYPVGHHVMFELESHKYAYVSQGFSTSVTLRADGPSYQDLFDARQDPDEATPVAYDNFYVIDVAEKRRLQALEDQEKQQQQ